MVIDKVCQKELHMVRRLGSMMMQMTLTTTSTRIAKSLIAKVINQSKNKSFLTRLRIRPRINKKNKKKAAGTMTTMSGDSIRTN